MVIKKKYVRALSPQAGLALSFMLVILLGTALLSLPVSSKAGPVPFIDALFTAASATCVTGLIVVDTNSYWSTFGHIIILCLIQIGGLGTMTFSSFVVLLVGRRLGIWDRQVLEQSFTGAARKSLIQLLWVAFLLTFLLEGVGAIILSCRFAEDHAVGQAIYLGVFHSISAFCNAGFSLFEANLLHHRGDFIINITIMTLIVLGGLGFWVIFDLKNLIGRKNKIRSASLHTRLVVRVTFFLISAGCIALLLLEWHSALRGLPIAEKVMAALFQSITARTAGFNTLDIPSLANGSIFILLILMIIGASPGSCGGGIKTTTFAVVLAMIYARLRNQKQVQFFKRGIPDATVSNAIGIAAAAFVIVSTMCLLLMITESSTHALMPQRTLFVAVFFETISAIGTVGLSMGLTPVLSLAGKIIIVLLMYVGRIGPVTLTLALAGVHARNLRYAEDNIWVG
ncbi:Trk family potassium uptake protein [candidate division KSB1 bacterium]|nr:Trk family potassium uptake protein [candidate division KSB1 bacterium]RQW02901.1 MAG: Trk family potassium uptake protein [candidate division KSB1 bacterium]